MSESIVGEVTLRGRAFSQEELSRIRALVEGSPSDHRAALSRKVCALLGWYQSNGRPKERSCRSVLQKLHDAGFLRLPSPRCLPPRRGPIALTERTAPRAPVELRPRDVSAQDFRILTGSRDRAAEALWNEYVERYHYLGYGTPVGPQIKYFVTRGDEPLACIVFSGPAWKVRCRDQWIGWSHPQRERHLGLIVNNTRFLILPWIQVKNLASRLLGLAAKRLPEDWERLYGYRPLLMETFVHSERHAGTCYRAANWIYVGQTDGRGRMDRHKRREKPPKSMFVFPITPDARATLASLPIV